MCVGIPMQVLENAGLSAWCAGRGGGQWISLALVGPQPAGTWLLTSLGAAREVMAADEACRVNCALDAVEAALRGDDVALGDYFPDLTGREPELPPHLKGK
jgi:hydrogenase expression/formation protein HypC